MSRAGLEWLYRLAREPRRLAYRYLVRDAAIVPLFAAMLLDRLRTRSSDVPAVST
jgi:UDP-N-acetyl-D-mannosaminuronic acid transferase (WecB/TagA/CpsF family)